MCLHTHANVCACTHTHTHTQYLEHVETGRKGILVRRTSVSRAQRKKLAAYVWQTNQFNFGGLINRLVDWFYAPPMPRAHTSDTQYRVSLLQMRTQTEPETHMLSFGFLDISTSIVSSPTFNSRLLKCLKLPWLPKCQDSNKTVLKS